MKTAFITLTNKGYLPYTLNCLKSLEKIGLNQLKCYAIGEQAHKKLAQKKYSVELIQDEENTNFQVFRQGNWASITMYKFKIIHESLKGHDFVCITDGDIVFKNPEVLSYCQHQIGSADLLIQNDTLSDDSDQNLCSGFMFIRSNEHTLKYFDPVYVEANSDIIEGWGDQVYINQIKGLMNYKLLPLFLFPNGQYFFKNHASISPYLIHFNWLIGHKKSAQFIKFRECYSSELLLLYIQKHLIGKYKNLIKRGLRNTGLLPIRKAS